MKLFKYLKLKSELRERMVLIDETMALKDIVDIYAKYVCKMNGWKVEVGSGYSPIFCDLGFAVMNGYNKALRDNGLKFQNGLVVKRDIANDMPTGALTHYEKDIRTETQRADAELLVRVLEGFKLPKSNINTIVAAFKEEQHAYTCF